MPKKSFHSGPSSNWLELQKTLKPKRKHSQTPEPSRKRSRVDDLTKESITPQVGQTSHGRANDLQNGESRKALKQLIIGNITLTDNQKSEGKYLAIDCEMVGVGPQGSESSLARVSIVNYYGAIVMDEYVKQRERVTDYRTQWSGIREKDMVDARPFKHVQKQVGELIDGRILIGHAIHNDLKALLLSHPRPLTRDTQHYAYKYRLVKSRNPALRNLVKQEFGLSIQQGEHSSVVDARATMAIFRLHRKEWEDSYVPPSLRTKPSDDKGSSTRKVQVHEKPGSDAGATSSLSTKSKSKTFITTARKRTIPGLDSAKGSQIVKTAKQNEIQRDTQWWTELPNLTDT